MSVVLPRQAIELVCHSKNPHEEMLKKVGDLSGVHPLYNWVLLATFIRPAKTKGGIIRPDSNIEEDVWQGKVGLVLKMGPAAFLEDDDFSMHGEKIEVGDWVEYSIGDTKSATVSEWPCRWIKDSLIRCRLDKADAIY